MPTLAQALAQMNPLFDDFVEQRGRDVTFVAAGNAAVFPVRAVEAASWAANDALAGEFAEQDFDLICRDNELSTNGMVRAPRSPDSFVIDGVRRAVEASTPMHVGGTLFGYRVLLSG